MSKNVLKIISDAMESLGLDYGFVEITDPSYPYFVGEYQESEPLNEDGMQDSTFILTGFSRDSWLELENAKQSIIEHFNKISGLTVMAEDGSAVAVFYSSAIVVPSEDAELKKIQINLSVKEWSVN